MKKLFYVVITTLLFASCVKTPEQKAEALIKEKLQQTLFHPETYAPAETQVDSAFTPYDDPAFYEQTLKLAKLVVAVGKYDQEAQLAKEEVAIYSVPYPSEYDRIQYQEAKKNYTNAVTKREKAVEEAKAVAQEAKKKINDSHEFIGFKATHTYRANNNAGQTLSGKALFIFDKEMKKIVASYDMDGEEYGTVEYFWKIMKGETSMADGISLE